MAYSVPRLHQLIHATTAKLNTSTTLAAALGSTCLLVNWITKRRKSSLETLPMDVLLEIFAYLDCIDIMRLRRVCQPLYNATKLRPVWLRLFHLDSQDPTSRRIFLDKTLESHSTAELERVVIKPHRGDFEWTNRDPRIREVEIEPNHKPLRILPGGRWCLAECTTQTANSVVCYDLSDTTSGHHHPASHFILVANPLPIEPPGTCYVSPPVFDVDIDYTTPYLTFTFAVRFTRSDFYHRVHRMYDHGEDGYYPVLQVWKVTPCFDACGRINKLATQHLRTFHRGTSDWCTFLQIRGQYIAVCEGGRSLVLDCVNTPAHFDASLPLIWENKRKYQHTIPNLYSLHALLPHQRILLHKGSKLVICQIPSAVTPEGHNFSTLPIIWKAKFPFDACLRASDIYGPFPSTDADVFLFLTLDSKPGLPSGLVAIPRDFTSSGQPNAPVIETVCRLNDLIGRGFRSGCGNKCFTILRYEQGDVGPILLRRGCLPRPLSTPLALTDIVFDDIDITLDVIRHGPLARQFIDTLLLDEYSHVVGLPIHTIGRTVLLLFESY